MPQQLLGEVAREDESVARAFSLARNDGVGEETSFQNGGLLLAERIRNEVRIAVMR